MASVTGYCHIGAQRERVPTHARARGQGSEGGVGGTGPNRMRVRLSLGRNIACQCKVGQG